MSLVEINGEKVPFPFNIIVAIFVMVLLIIIFVFVLGIILFVLGIITSPIWGIILLISILF